MNFFAFDIKKLLIALTLVLVPLFAINMETRPSESSALMRPFQVLSGFVQLAYSSFSSGIRGTTSLYLNLIDIKKNNRTLLNENAELRAKLGELTELKLENTRLNKLLGFQEKSKMDLLAAKVIGKDLIPDHFTITIDRGTHHGVHQFMAAITTAGAVGYVIQSQLFTSQILLLTDRYASIDAIVQRSRARGILEGKNSKSCQLNYLQREDDVKKGDLLVTSGLDDIFPKGYAIGTVTHVEKNEYDISQRVEVKPVLNPSSLEEIFIVLKSNQENFGPPEIEEENQETEESKPSKTSLQSNNGEAE